MEKPFLRSKRFALCTEKPFRGSRRSITAPALLSMLVLASVLM
jgi:hypothetical protein